MFPLPQKENLKTIQQTIGMSLSYNKSSPPIKFDGRKWRRGQQHTFPSRRLEMPPASRPGR